MFVARLVVGKELRKALAECVTEIRSISLKILKVDTAYFMRIESDGSPRSLVELNTEALAQKIMAVYRAACGELKIEIAD